VLTYVGVTDIQYFLNVKADDVCNVDIDECATNTAGCDTHASCSNTFGFFTCSCNKGYTGNGHTCKGMSSAEAGLCVELGIA